MEFRNQADHLERASQSSDLSCAVSPQRLGDQELEKKQGGDGHCCTRRSGSIPLVREIGPSLNDENRAKGMCPARLRRESGQLPPKRDDRRVTLSRATIAPDFTLRDADGRSFRLSDAYGAGPVLVTFYKTSCPTCQYGLPFLDRLGSSLDSGGGTAVAVCQDTARDAEMFAQQFGISMRQVFDTEAEGFPVSNLYGITHVPSTFLIDESATIQRVMVSWCKDDVEGMARELSLDLPFRPNEHVLPFRPG